MPPTHFVCSLDLGQLAVSVLAAVIAEPLVRFLRGRRRQTVRVRAFRQQPLRQKGGPR